MSLTIISGCMYAGKTEELLRRIRYLSFTKQKVLLCKPAKDDRYRIDSVASHNGSYIPANSIRDISEVDLLIEKNGSQAIGIDEVQFLSGNLVDFCQRRIQTTQLILAGLDLDSDGNQFLPPLLFSLATEIVKLHAACHACGLPAYRTKRMISNTEQILVGGMGIYEARCFLHWNE